MESRLAKRIGGIVEYKGKREPVVCLLDDLAEINVIPRHVAIPLDIKRLEGASLPFMESFRDEKGYCGDAYAVRMRLADSSGDERMTTSSFFAAEMLSDKLLLGRPWRRQDGIIVDSSDDR